jgi:hypothetical protein
MLPVPPMTAESPLGSNPSCSSSVSLPLSPPSFFFCLFLFPLPAEVEVAGPDGLGTRLPVVRPNLDGVVFCIGQDAEPKEALPDVELILESSVQEEGDTLEFECE